MFRRRCGNAILIALLFVVFVKALLATSRAELARRTDLLAYSSGEARVPQQAASALYLTIYAMPLQQLPPAAWHAARILSPRAYSQFVGANVQRQKSAWPSFPGVCVRACARACVRARARVWPCLFSIRVACVSVRACVRACVRPPVRPSRPPVRPVPSRPSLLARVCGACTCRGAEKHAAPRSLH